MTTTSQKKATNEITNVNYPLIIALLVAMWFVTNIHAQAGFLIYVVDYIIIIAASYAINNDKFKNSKSKHPFFMGATWQGLLFWIISFFTFFTINFSL